MARGLGLEELLLGLLLLLHAEGVEARLLRRDEGLLHGHACLLRHHTGLLHRHARDLALNERIGDLVLLEVGRVGTVNWDISHWDQSLSRKLTCWSAG